MLLKKIELLLDKLAKMKASPEYFTHFNSPVNELKTIIFEKMNQLNLPDSFKIFMKKFNGGMMVYDYQDEFLQTQADFEMCKKDSVYLLSIDEMGKKYAHMCTLALQRGSRNSHPYPFIPFCTLPDGSFLVFVTKPDSVIESPVFLACHNKSEKTWGEVAPDFTHFLELYLHHLGHPPIVEDKKNVATAFFESLVKTKKTTPYLQTQEVQLLNQNEQAYFYYQQALDCRFQDDFSTAYTLISKAIEINPANAFFYFFRGEILKEVTKYRAGIVDYDSAVKLDSNNSFYLCCRAEIFIHLKKFDRALSDCNEALKMNSKSVLPYYLRKDIYFALGEISKAEAEQKTIDFLENKD